MPDVSRETGISESTLYTWVARYRQNSMKPFVGSGHIKPEDEEFEKRFSILNVFCPVPKVLSFPGHNRNGF